VLILCGLAFAAFFWWANQMYAFGMDVNLKVFAVAGAALVLVAGATLAVALSQRRRREKVR